jgi:hypothetical protein
MRYGWFDTVANELRSGGVNFNPTDLILSGPPVPLPLVDDFPAIGHLRHTEMPALLNDLQGLRRDDVDPDALESIVEIVSWLKTCLHRKRALVCFYH